MSVSKTGVAFVLVFLGLLAVSCGLNPQNGSKDSGKRTDRGIFQVKDSGTPLVPVSNAVFVLSNGGDDGNSGVSPDQAVKTIQNALTKVNPNGTIYVAGGDYSGPVVLSNRPGLRIIGCCANGFDFYSTALYPTKVSSGVTVQNSGNVTLDSLFASGLTISSVSNSLFTNIIMTNGGAALSITRGIGNAISASIFNGGGLNNNAVGMTYCLSNTLNLSLVNCWVYGAPGNVIMNISSCTNNTLNGIVSNNNGVSGCIYLYRGLSNIINADVISNATPGNTESYSGGISLRYENGSAINGKVLSNYSTNSGGGVSIYYSSNITINGEVGYNLSRVNGGGICAVNSSNVVLSSTSKIYCNSAINGGGLNVTNTVGLDAEGLISNNRVSAYGMAVYSTSNQNLTINGLINAHTSTWGYTGTVYSIGDKNLKVGVHLTGNVGSYGDLTAVTLSNTSSAIFDGAIFDNNGSYAPNCIYGLYSTNITIINSLFTNNNTTTGSMIYLLNSSANTSLVISNNTLGYGINAIYVSQPTSVAKFVFTYNHFMYGTLNTLYSNPLLSQQINDSLWPELNLTNAIYATEAHDNTDN